MITRIIVKTIISIAALVAIVASIFGLYVWRTWDRVYDEVPIPDVRASRDPAVIAHGEYLVHGPAHCASCHISAEDAARVVAGEVVPLRGGLDFPAPPLGVIYTRNLTPDPETGIGRYSDGLIARMMRYNVRPDGRASIGPMMPFHNMSEDDMLAVISFLRSQSPVRNPVPANEWTTMGKVIRTVSSTFKPRSPDVVSPPRTAPAEEPTPQRGEYLARYVGNCVGCHTPRDLMTFEATGPDFSGGFEMEPARLPGADSETWYRTPNITPAKGSALMKFPDRATFVARFRVGGRQQPGSPMPWESYARMSDTDLSALYEFLMTLPASSGFAGEVTFQKAH